MATIKRYLNKKSRFFTRLLTVQLIILSSALECTKNNTLWDLAQEGVAPLQHHLLTLVVH